MKKGLIQSAVLDSFLPESKQWIESEKAKN